MRSRTIQWIRRARVVGMILTAGAVFQTTTCSTQVSNLLFELTSTILGQLITGYVNDQLNVTPGLF